MDEKISQANQGAIKLVCNAEFNLWTKHIDVKYHYIRGQEQEQEQYSSIDEFCVARVKIKAVGDHATPAFDYALLFCMAGQYMGTSFVNYGLP